MKMETERLAKLLTANGGYMYQAKTKQQIKKQLHHGKIIRNPKPKEGPKRYDGGTPLGQNIQEIPVRINRKRYVLECEIYRVMIQNHNQA